MADNEDQDEDVFYDALDDNNPSDSTSSSSSNSTSRKRIHNPDTEKKVKLAKLSVSGPEGCSSSSDDQDAHQFQDEAVTPEGANRSDGVIPFVTSQAQVIERNNTPCICTRRYWDDKDVKEILNRRGRLSCIKENTKPIFLCSCNEAADTSTVNGPSNCKIIFVPIASLNLTPKQEKSRNYFNNKIAENKNHLCKALVEAGYDLRQLCIKPCEEELKKSVVSIREGREFHHYNVKLDDDFAVTVEFEVKLTDGPTAFVPADSAPSRGTTPFEPTVGELLQFLGFQANFSFIF